MKVRNLLFMAALTFVGASASAEVVDGVRQVPVPQKSGLTYGNAMYLYNQSAKKFFLGANSYNTRASGGDKGYLVKVEQTENGITITDSVETQKAWKKLFQDTDGNMWVDYNNQTNYYWALTEKGDDVYNITLGENNPDYTPAAYPDSYYMGVKADDNAETPLLYWNLTSSDKIDWYFVSVDGYKAYSELITLYSAAKPLKTQLDAAVAAGVAEANIASYRTVYENEQSTVEEIEAAIAGVKAAISAAAEESVTVDNPVDETSFIQSPDYSSGAATGWSGTTPGFGYNCAEQYNKTYDFYQTIKGLPKGVYAVKVNAFYRAGWCANDYEAWKAGNTANKLAKLYAVVGTDTVVTPIKYAHEGAVETKYGVGGEMDITGSESGTEAPYIANNMQAAEQYLNSGSYVNTLFFSVSADSTKIGLYKKSTLSGDWTLYNTWSLTYYGKGADAYSMWLKDMISQTPDFTYLEDDEDAQYTASVLEAYKETKAGYTTASSEAEVMEAYKAVNAAADGVTENVELWKSLEAAVTKAREQVLADGNIQGQDKDDLGDYIDDYVTPAQEELELTNDEIKEMIAKVEEMTKSAIDNGITAGTDVTEKYLVNANFETTSGSNTGWITTGSGGNRAYGGDNTNHCYEAWNASSFDVYQIVKNAPKGVYSISVQGFYRYLRDAASWTAYLSGEAAQYQDVVKVYVNDNTSSLKNVYDEKTEYGSYDKAKYSASGATVVGATGAASEGDSLYWFPNTMAQAAWKFSEGAYTSTSYGVVANAGDELRIGVKGVTNQGNDSWSIWDNFKMVYEGTNADVVKPLLEAKKTEVQATLDNTDLLIGSEISSAINADMTKADEAITAEDGEAMFDALAALISDQGSIEASKAAFDSLTTANENLSADLAYYSEARDEAVEAASNLYEEINGHLTSKDLTTDQAREYIAKIATADAALKIPKGTETATEDNPVDMTDVIQTPSYEKDGANSIDGWVDVNGNKNFGNDATQKQALLLEYYNNYFNIYQNLTSLPAGYYKVQVKAFYRYGTTAEDYAHYTAGDTNDNVYMYAVAADTVKTNLQLLGAGALTEDPGYSGQTSLTDPVVYLPSSMQSANSWFGDGYYITSLTVKVEADGKLTIGIRKNTKVGSDWVIFDDWHLYYLGTATPSGIQGISSAEDAAGAIQEIYTLGGARTNSLQKGVNIVKTKNGAVKKVIVK